MHNNLLDAAPRPCIWQHFKEPDSFELQMCHEFLNSTFPHNFIVSSPERLYSIQGPINIFSKQMHHIKCNHHAYQMLFMIWKILTKLSLKINFSFKVHYKYGPKVLPWAKILSSSTCVKIHFKHINDPSQPAC